MRPRLLVGILAVGAMATAAPGCGTTSRTSVSGSLNPQVAAAYVDAQAHALCLVQSKAYPTQAALHAAYLRAEQSADLPAPEFARAAAAALDDPALRTQLSDRVAALCGTHPIATGSK
jgi:hypothetical protein